jgi:hypothetical protein
MKESERFFVIAMMVWRDSNKIKYKKNLYKLGVQSRLLQLKRVYHLFCFFSILLPSCKMVQTVPCKYKTGKVLGNGTYATVKGKSIWTL